MKLQEKPQPHRSKSVIALMAKRTPMALEPHMGPEAVRHMRETCQYLPALKPGSLEAQIIEHIHNGEEQEALDLLDQGANPRAEDEVGLTLLHHSGAAGMLILTDRLMDKGAYADAFSIMDESVLSYVILMNAEGPGYSHKPQPERGNGKNNILAVVDRLIRRRPDLEQPDDEGNTAALHTAHIGDMDVMARLKQAGANLKHCNHVGADVTCKSAQAGHYMMIEQYQHWGIDPRPRDDADLSARDIAAALVSVDTHNSWRYIRCAQLLARGEVMAEAREIAKMPLIGADLTRVIDNVNAYRQVHENALKQSDNALAQTSLAIVSEMCGFEPIHPDSLEMFMLSKAVNNEHDFLLATLERGADASATDPFGRTGIILQAMRGFHTGMSPLKHLGCDINAQDAMLESALHCSAMAQSRDAVRTVLALGGNPLARNWKGLTPRQQMILHYATPVSDDFNPLSGREEQVVRSAEDITRLLGAVVLSVEETTKGTKPGAAPFVAVISGGEVPKGPDPVILSWLEMAESRWLRGEANYQASLRAKKAAPN